MSSVEVWFERLGETGWSVALRESAWVYPVIEGIHTLTIAMFVGFAVLLDLRLMGVFMRRTAVSQVESCLLPRTRWAFLVMVCSGLLLFSSNPLGFYQNIFFRVKVLLMVLAGLNVWYFHRRACRDMSAWDNDAIPPVRVRLSGTASLLFWVVVTVCGRLIAYNWFQSPV